MNYEAHLRKVDPDLFNNDIDYIKNELGVIGCAKNLTEIYFDNIDKMIEAVEKIYGKATYDIHINNDKKIAKIYQVRPFTTAGAPAGSYSVSRIFD